MHYYQFNIADYRKDTQHLSPIEHYIYRELMDWYYLDEQPITQNNPRVLRRLRLGSENETDLVNVLDEFFTLSGDEWAHGRIEAEIALYKTKAETARVNGSKGGRPKKPRKTQPVVLANPEKPSAKLTINQEPLTINQLKDKDSVGKPTTRKQFKPPESSEVQEYLASKSNTTIDPNHFLDFYAARGWKLSSGTKMADWKAAVRTWISRENKNNGQNRPGSNTSQNERNPTPAERVKAKHAEIYGRDTARETPAAHIVVSVQ